MIVILIIILKTLLKNTEENSTTFIVKIHNFLTMFFRYEQNIKKTKN